jgi:cytoskeleton protein RodZ
MRRPARAGGLLDEGSRLTPGKKPTAPVCLAASQTLKAKSQKLPPIPLLPDRVKFRSSSTTSETGLPSFGAKLKQEREKRKISLEEISGTTKIGTRMLQALEEDKFDQLPGGIFNKGFVRSYSRCVGLDEDQTVAEYLVASGDAPPPRTDIGFDGDVARASEENIRRLEAISDTPRRPVPWGYLAALLLLVALALSLWTRQQRQHAKTQVQAAPPAATTPAPIAGSGQEATPRNGNEASANSPSSVPPKDESVSSSVPGEFTVVIQAREDSWVSITDDGKTTASELLAAGGERTVKAQKEILVKVGNSGGVNFIFNGKKVETGGEYGVVKTVAFGPNGISPAPPTP